MRSKGKWDPDAARKAWKAERAALAADIQRLLALERPVLPGDWKWTDSGTRLHDGRAALIVERGATRVEARALWTPDGWTDHGDLQIRCGRTGWHTSPDAAVRAAAALREAEETAKAAEAAEDAPPWRVSLQEQDRERSRLNYRSWGDND